MRLIKVSVPDGMGERVIQTAFSVGIEKASIHPAVVHSSDGKTEKRDVVDVEVSTREGKHFILALMKSDYYDPKTVSANIRMPRAIIGPKQIRKLTIPIEQPGPDLYEEFWQISQITYSLVIRVFIGGGILAYGIINSKLLLIVAGLLFLPTMSQLMGLGFGLLSRERNLVFQAIKAFATCIAGIFLASALVALFSRPPVLFNDFSSIPVTLAISAVVGIAGGLAQIDDVGHRELIALAAAAQIALIPSWVGIVAILGVPAQLPESEAITKALTFLGNTILITFGSGIVFYLTHAATATVHLIAADREN